MEKKENVIDSFIAAFAAMDLEIAEHAAWRREGSTAVGVYITPTEIYSMNVGDSRAVLARDHTAIELTKDHKPNEASERARIEDIGGTVKWYGYTDLQGEPIKDMGVYRVNGNLAVSRSLGDEDLKPYVIVVPCGARLVSNLLLAAGDEKRLLLVYSAWFY